MENRLFHRSVVFVDAPIRSCFKFQDEFQFYYDDCLPTPIAHMAHHPIVLEHYYEAPKELIDKVANNTLTMDDSWKLSNFQNERFNSILNLLTVFTSQHFFAYDKKHKNQSKAWFSPLSFKRDGQINEIVYKSTFGAKVFHDLPKSQTIGFSRLDGMQISLVPRASDAYRFFSESISFPEDINDLLVEYFTLDNSSKLAFDNSCTLFSKGIELWEISYSLSFVAYVSCLETLIHHDNKDSLVSRCDLCGQPKYQVTKKFLDFLIRYGFKDQEYKRIAKLFYEIRSKIMHQGELLLNDSLFTSTEQGDYQLNVLRELKRITGICLRNWLMK